MIGTWFDDLPEDEQVELIHTPLSDELKISCGEDLSEEVYLKPAYKKDKILTPKDFPGFLFTKPIFHGKI